MAHEVYFVPGHDIFTGLVMAKWYHENGIKTPLRVNHFKNYAYTFIFLDALSILFRRV